MGLKQNYFFGRKNASVFLLGVHFSRLTGKKYERVLLRAAGATTQHCVPEGSKTPNVDQNPNTFSGSF